MPKVVLEVLRAGPEAEAELAKRYRRLGGTNAAAKVAVFVLFAGWFVSQPASGWPLWSLAASMFALGVVIVPSRWFLARATTRGFTRACEAADERRMLVFGGVWAATAASRWKRPIALYVRAMAYAAVDEDREALAALDEIDQEACPPDLLAQLPLMRAGYLARTGQSARGLEILAELAKTGTTASQLDGTIGMALVHDGRAEESIAPLERTLVTYGASALVQFYLAEAQRMTGHSDAARGSYERAAVAPGTERWRRAARRALQMETYRSAARAKQR